MSIGKTLRNERSKKGLTQVETAKELGISNVVLNRYEKDERQPDIWMVNKLASYYNCSVDYLLGNTNQRTPIDQLPAYTTSPTEPYLNDLLKKVPDLTDEEKESLEEHMQFALKIIEKERLRRRAAAQKKDGDLL